MRTINDQIFQRWIDDAKHYLEFLQKNAEECAQSLEAANTNVRRQQECIGELEAERLELRHARAMLHLARHGWFDATPPNHCSLMANDAENIRHLQRESQNAPELTDAEKEELVLAVKILDGEA